VPLDEVFAKRMEIIRPNREMAERVCDLYIGNIVPGAAELISMARSEGWTPVIVSGGFAPLIAPLARHLDIGHVEAVPLCFMDSGEYAGYGTDYPTTRNLGKNEIIREWKKAMLPERVVMIGDGVSDLETKPDVDMMIGFGGVVLREKVSLGADVWLEDLADACEIPGFLK
jgi:phosphoserine phosphatase